MPQRSFQLGRCLQLGVRERFHLASDEAVAAELEETSAGPAVLEALVEMADRAVDSLGETDRPASTTLVSGYLELDLQMVWTRRISTTRRSSRTRPPRQSPSSTTGRAASAGAR